MVREGIDRSIHNDLALHYENHPGHAYALLLQLAAETSKVVENAPDDPLLLAYTLRDSYKSWVTYLTQIGVWVSAVLDADDPSIPSTGVH